MVDDEIDDWEEWDSSKISFLSHMIAGSLAGLAEHVIVFPLDTIKTHIQCERCGSISPSQTWNCAARIVSNEGMFRLWRGVSAMFAGCLPAHAAYFSIYESTKKFLGADQTGHHPIKASLCGASAAFSHDLIMNPFDVLKQRMQLGHHKNIINCANITVRSEGIRALYISLPATLMMNIPYGCIMVPVNESTKKFLNPSGKYNFVVSMVSGAIAGAAAAALTNPLDVVKTRLQTQNLLPCPVSSSIQETVVNVTKKKNSCDATNMPFISNSSIKKKILGRNHYVTDCIENTNNNNPLTRHSSSIKKAVQKIIQEEGYKGFLRGIYARILIQAPAVAISWTTYETIKKQSDRLTAEIFKFYDYNQQLQTGDKQQGNSSFKNKRKK